MQHFQDLHNCTNEISRNLHTFLLLHMFVFSNSQEEAETPIHYLTFRLIFCRFPSDFHRNPRNREMKHILLNMSTGTLRRICKFRPSLSENLPNNSSKKVNQSIILGDDPEANANVDPCGLTDTSPPSGEVSARISTQTSGGSRFT